MELIDFRLSQADPTDLLGFPTLNEDRSRSHYAPPSTFPLKEDSIPVGKNGWLLFFDELPSAPMSVQAASYKIILDRMIGEHHLHPNVYIVAAGNLSTDKAIVNRMSTAMQSRMVHLELEVSLDAFMNWGNINKVDYRILSFLKFKPELLYNFNPNHSDNTFACSRTWFFLHKIIHKWETISSSKLPVIAGTVGEGAAYEFFAFIEIMESLPSIEKILANPNSIEISNDPSILYAITGLIAHHAKETNIEKLMVMIERLSIEFQIICLQDVIKHNSVLTKTKPIQDWIRVNSKLLASKGVL